MDNGTARENDLVRKLSSQFKSKIVPSQIIHHFDVQRISREEEELILAEETNKGPMAAAYLLLKHLAQKYDWFNNLLRTLRRDDVRLHHVAYTFEEIKRQVDEDWNSLPQKNPHSVSDINQTTVNEFKFGKPKSDYVTDVGHSGRPYLKKIETAEKGEASMYVDARSADNKPDKSELKDKILEFLKTNPGPQETIKIAKACGYKSRSDVNPVIYSLEKEGLLQKCTDQPPSWQYINTNECTEHKEDDGYATLNYSIQKSTDESDVYDLLENIHLYENPEYHNRQRDTAAQSHSQVVEELEGAPVNVTSILKEMKQTEKQKTETVYTEDQRCIIINYFRDYKFKNVDKLQVGGNNSIISQASGLLASSRGDYATGVCHSRIAELRKTQTAEKFQSSMYVDGRSADNKSDKAQSDSDLKEVIKKEKLRKCYEYIKDEIEPRHFVDRMVTKGALTFDDEDLINNTQPPTRKTRAEVLLKLVLNGKPHISMYDIFVEALKENYPWVVKELEEIQVDETFFLKEMEQNEKKKTETAFTESERQIMEVFKDILTNGDAKQLLADNMSVIAKIQKILNIKDPYKTDSGKTTKRVTHEENENNNPASHVRDSPNNHCGQQKLAQSCSQVAEELEGARANETANKRDSGKNTKRVTHEENENNKPTSHVCGSSYNHCEQQKLNVLEEKIIAFLKTKTEPQPTLTIAKACCCETPKDVNPSLHGLAKKNIIKQCDTRSPTWQMM